MNLLVFLMAPIQLSVSLVTSNKPPITFEPILFPGYIVPNGFLDRNRESHALWFYYLHARGTWENNVQNNPWVYEGDLDPGFNFRQLFNSIALIYGVEHSAMAKCWPMIDLQCLALQLPTLPDEERYRFNRAIILN